VFIPAVLVLPSGGAMLSYILGALIFLHSQLARHR